MAGHHVDSLRHESNEAALMRELGEAKRQRDAAEAERDRLRDDAAVVADLMTDKHNRYVALRDAARAFLELLKRRVIAEGILAGPELDALREACK